LPTPDPQLDQLLRTAIEQTRLLRLRYRNRDRIVEPHDYGEHNGVIKLLTWQIAGSSCSPLPNWRWKETDRTPTLSYSIRPSLADARRHPASITNGTSCSSESSRPVRTEINRLRPVSTSTTQRCRKLTVQEPFRSHGQLLRAQEKYGFDEPGSGLLLLAGSPSSLLSMEA
jgi:hypothetical protein